MLASYYNLREYEMSKKTKMSMRFDGYLPVVVDVETTGVDPTKHGLLELAAVTVDYNESGVLEVSADSYSSHVQVFEGAKIDQQALKINKIDPDHPFRFAISEEKMLHELFKYVNAALKKTGCRRAVLVGHNAHFDLSFMQAAMKRCKITQSPFHHFTVFDTATIGGLVFGKTILAKVLKEAKIEFNKDEAHSALYDTLKTADLFCQAVNKVALLDEPLSASAASVVEANDS